VSSGGLARRFGRLELGVFQIYQRDTIFAEPIGGVVSLCKIVCSHNVTSEETTRRSLHLW